MNFLRALQPQKKKSIIPKKSGDDEVEEKAHSGQMQPLATIGLILTSLRNRAAAEKDESSPSSPGRIQQAKLLFEHAVEVLKTPPKSRDMEDLTFMLGNYIRQIEFFKNQPNDLSLDCCKYMGYEFATKDDIVFELGQRGTKFYIVLKGEVQVYVSMNNDELEEMKKKRTLELTQQRRGTIKLKKTTKQQELLNQKLHGLTPVVKLESGKSFGELALMHEKPRAATIVCTRDTHFAVLEKEDYQSILGARDMQKYSQDIDFLQSLPPFGSWTRIRLAKFLNYIKFRTQYRNSTIFKEDEPATHVFIIKRGEVKITKDKVQMQNKIKEYKFSKAKTGNNNLKVRNVDRIELTILGRGEILGMEDIFEERNRLTSAICVTPEVELMVISREDFVKRINLESTWAQLKRMANVKNTWLNQRLGKISVFKSKSEKAMKKYILDMKFQNKTTLQLSRSPKTGASPLREPRELEDNLPQTQRVLGTNTDKQLNEGEGLTPLSERIEFGVGIGEEGEERRNPKLSELLREMKSSRKNRSVSPTKETHRREKTETLLPQVDSKRGTPTAMKNNNTFSIFRPSSSIKLQSVTAATESTQESTLGSKRKGSITVQPRKKARSKKMRSGEIKISGGSTLSASKAFALSSFKDQEDLIRTTSAKCITSPEKALELWHQKTKVEAFLLKSMPNGLESGYEGGSSKPVSPVSIRREVKGKNPFQDPKIQPTIANGEGDTWDVDLDGERLSHRGNSPRKERFGSVGTEGDQFVHKTVSRINTRKLHAQELNPYYDDIVTHGVTQSRSGSCVPLERIPIHESLAALKRTDTEPLMSNLAVRRGLSGKKKRFIPSLSVESNPGHWKTAQSSPSRGGHRKKTSQGGIVLELRKKLRNDGKGGSTKKLTDFNFSEQLGRCDPSPGGSPEKRFKPLGTMLLKRKDFTKKNETNSIFDHFGNGQSLNNFSSSSTLKKYSQ